MKKIFAYLLCVFITQNLFFTQKVEAVEIAGASASLIGPKVVQTDPRAKQVRGFLEYYKSPLVDYSDHFVLMADKYNIDWRLLVAISGVESTFGKQIINGSFNAYGWGGGKIYFDSWEDSIEKVSQALSEKYYSRGLDTPYKIAPVYCPPSKVWAGNVAYFMNKLQSFQKENSLKTFLTYSF